MNARLIAYALLLLAAVGVGGCSRDSDLATTTVSPTESPTTTAPQRTVTTTAPSATTASQRTVTTTAPSATKPPCATPTVVGVSTEPALPIKDGWLTLPDVAGTVTFKAQATGATEVQFLPTPTGTDTASLARPLGTDQTAHDGFTLTWSYPKEPLSDHFSVVAIGPCGRAEALPCNVYHD